MRIPFAEITAIVGITLLSLILHGVAIERPNRPIFDEVHFATYASAYASGTAFFDIHPPLGKMIYAGVLRIFGESEYHEFIRFWRGADHKLAWETSHEKPWGDFPYVPLRFTHAFFGILLVPLVYLFTRLLGISGRSSLLAAGFIALDNALLLQTRLILMDGFLLFFGLLGFVLLLAKNHVNEKWHKYLALGAALSFGFAGAVKLTGFGFLLGVLVAVLLQTKISLRPLSWKMFLVVAVAPVFLLFLVHRALIPLSDELVVLQTIVIEQANPDASWYERSRTIPFGGPLLFAATYVTHLFLLVGAGTNDFVHPAESDVFLWPLGIKPVPYLQGTLVFSGNVALWAGGAIAIATAAFFGFMKKKKHQMLLFIGWMAYLAPFILLSFTRSTYLYHYLPALLFGIVALAAMRDEIPQRFQNIFTGAIICAAIAGFVIRVPQTYGF